MSVRLVVWIGKLAFSLLLFGVRCLDELKGEKASGVSLPVGEVLQTLNDLITYFQQPDSELEHEEKQRQLRSLIKRQDLFKEEVSLAHKVKYFSVFTMCSCL